MSVGDALMFGTVFPGKINIVFFKALILFKCCNMLQSVSFAAGDDGLLFETH